MAVTVTAAGRSADRRAGAATAGAASAASAAGLATLGRRIAEAVNARSEIKIATVGRFARVSDRLRIAGIPADPTALSCRCECRRRTRRTRGRERRPSYEIFASRIAPMPMTHAPRRVGEGRVPPSAVDPLATTSCECAAVHERRRHEDQSSQCDAENTITRHDTPLPDTHIFLRRLSRPPFSMRP